jgi:4-diphosphocytidyl-2-C-methyl-D-erythritol kinase
MILFPPCKINLGLRVGKKRADGYHNLETLFYPIPLTDALEIVSGNENQTGAVLQTYGLEVPGDTNQNLILKAYQLIAKDYNLGPVTFALLKQIPMGAGLGGGSSDGAFAIRLINAHFGLNLSIEKQCNYAAMLGSDCAFFIYDKPCIGLGRGEILKPIDFSLRGYWIVLINPEIHVSTAAAFAGLKHNTIEKEDVISIEEVLVQNVEKWKYLLENDFEKSVFEIHPILKEIKDILYLKGASYAAMSGSGSTLFGLFKEKPKLDGLFQTYFYREFLLV